ncbi:MAG: M13 family metallopeptidase [Acidobacteria bacterium]|nr:M13 family metallopeptidase [Acidobacteriota bacterium]
MKKNILPRFLAVTLALSLVGQSFAQYRKGFETSRMDTECKPCEDFYKYVNGGWLKTAKIPDDKARWGGFEILAENNRTILKGILEAAAANKKVKAGSNEYMIGAMYATCMDEAAIEKSGKKPIEPYLTRIAKINDLKSLQAEITALDNLGLSVLFGFGAGPDLKNSTMNIASLGQGGLSLPNKDFYTKTDEKSQQTRAAFVKHVSNMFKLLGDTEAVASANAETVLKIQTKLAEASLAPVELRNPNNRYNKKTVAELQELAPNWEWKAYFTGRGAASFTELNVGQPKFLKAVSDLMKEIPVADWKTLLRWEVVHSSADQLSSAFVNENFDFYGKVLSGQKEKAPRWRTCTQVVDGSIGDILGQVYVAKQFPPESKARMNTLIDNLVLAYRERIQQLDWMSEATKKQALLKLNSFARKIGYPDKWKTYAGLKIDRKSYFENSLRVGQFALRENMAKINQPIDKSEWLMSPPTVNAYYMPINNEIAFPAGILQPPFFNPEADDAINYGAIGAVIGHELSHGFDDSGSQFDEKGNLRMWWTPEDRKKFEARADCVVQQFNGFKVQDGLNVNGKLVLGESIGDLGGLTMAYYAFKKSLEGKPRPANIDGFTPEQRFFIGYAQIWATVARPEFERNYTLSDPHPLGRFRANGPLSNFQPFAEAFGCKKGDPMVRDSEKRCEIW